MRHSVYICAYILYISQYESDKAVECIKICILVSKYSSATVAAPI